MTALIILMLILLFGGFVLAIYGYEKRRELCLGFGLILYFIGAWGFSAILTHKNPFNIHSKDMNIKTEIRQEIINGKEVSVDTVYIFTPKKK